MEYFDENNFLLLMLENSFEYQGWWCLLIESVIVARKWRQQKKLKKGKQISCLVSMTDALTVVNLFFQHLMYMRCETMNLFPLKDMYHKQQG